MKSERPIRLVNPDFAERVEPLRAARIVEDAEVHIVDVVAARYGEHDPDVLVALTLALRASREGHAGVDLAELDVLLGERERPRVVGEPDAQEERREEDEEDGPRGGDDEAEVGPDEELDDEGEDEDASGPDGASGAHLSLPEWLKRLGLPSDAQSAADWNERVARSPLVQPIGSDDARPFVVQERLEPGARLLLTRRMAREQERLVDALRELAASSPRPSFALPKKLPIEVDGRAKEAVERGVTHRLSLVTGGPGTGKTYSIKLLLATLLELHGSASEPLRVHLAAPTGKAAVRMTEALHEGLDTLEGASEATREAIRGLTSSTVHKLLRARRDGTFPKRGQRPLRVDVLVVDEVSMVGLTLMRRLLEAIPGGARLVLIGDPAQLASVDAGTVLADLVSKEGEALLGTHHTRLVEAHRFANPELLAIIERLQTPTESALDGAVGALTKLPHAQKNAKAKLRYLGASEDGRPTSAQLDLLAEPYLEGYAKQLAEKLRAGADLRDEETQLELLQAFGRYRVLAVHRRGPLGVSGLLESLGARVRDFLERVHRERGATSNYPTKAGHWLGEPILVTRNDYAVHLWNGDIGLVLPGDGKDKLVAVFEVEQGGEPTVQRVPLDRLPPHMGALAMTVHKSQGSQFDHVALVLAGRSSPIQTRELVYTGITRAKSRLDWLGTDDELAEALRKPIRRTSGLRELLSHPDLGA